MTPALTFKNVCLSYGSHDVIRTFDATIPDGSVTGLIGLNGAGKTTLIKSALGLRDASEGKVLVYGHAAGSVDAKKSLSFLPEHFHPPEFLNGYEFLDFACRFYQGTADRQTILDYGNVIGMNDIVLSRRVHTYSKGMRQKLGIMGAVLAKASCLVLDEPMAGLDPAARIAVKELLIQARRNGKTIVLSSHMLADMDDICDTLLVIAGNRLQFQGMPSELKRQGASDNLEKSFLALVGEDAS